MPKELVAEARFDFSGGINTHTSVDTLAENELSDADNARIVGRAITIRQGSRRLHATALASAPIKGIIQWDGPSGSQLVAICNGDLFYRNQSSGEYAAFTQVDPGATDAFSTTSPAIFWTLRGSAESAPLRLYIASGGKLYEWSGTTLLRLDGPTSSTGQFAPDASVGDGYHLRSFTNSILRPQHVIWSRLGDGRVFKGGLAADGGTAMISAVEADSITAMKTLGRSLIVATKSAIARVAGYSAADIQIDQDTESLAPSVGIVGPQAVARYDNVIFFTSERGAYIASEGAISYIGQKIEAKFNEFDRTKLSECIVAVHKGRREVFFFRPAIAGNNNAQAHVYSIQHQIWHGTHTWAFGITSACSYTDPLGNEYIIAGCQDGFVRHLDIGTKDDVLSDGTSGTNLPMTAVLPPLFFSHPGVVFTTTDLFIEHKSTAFIYVVIEHQGGGSAVNFPVPLNTGSVFQSTRVDYPEVQGKRLIITLSKDTSQSGDGTMTINGLILHAYNMLRY